MNKIFLTGLLLEELQKECAARGFEPYRARQILEWIYQRQVLDFFKMKNLPKPLVAFLTGNTIVSDLQVVERAFSHKDKSVKYLFRLCDDELVEAVWMPQSGFKTICVSTQVGCPLKCTFCASGQVLFKRNLMAHEIIGQILMIQQDLKDQDRPSHIVFMGMGEPLLNFENLFKAISILKAPWGLAIGARRITVSTAGFVPGILKWAQAAEDFHQIRLSVSLHGTHDDARDLIMPINQKYPIEDLMKALEVYCEKTGRRVTFEYLLLKDVNDERIDAQALSEMVRGIAHSVNVIEYNEVDGTHLQSSPHGEAFVEELRAQGVTATYRRSKGRDIEAACGQLRAKFVENKGS